MANTDRVNGFRPVGTLSGGLGALGWIQRCLVDEDDSTALAVNDLVKLATSNESNGMPTVAALAAASSGTNVPYGCVVGFENWDNGRDSSVTQTLEKPRIRSASTRGYALVAVSPDLVMEAQVSTGGDLEDGDIGAKADIVAAGADTTAQSSGMEVLYSSMGATADTSEKHPLHIFQLVEKADNALGAHAKVLVTFNTHQLGRGVYVHATTEQAGQLGVHA